MDLARGLSSARWSDDGSLEQAFIASVRHLADQHQLDLSVLHGDGTNTVAKKGGDGIGYSGHKHQKGEKVIAIIDNNGYVLAPLPVAPVNEADTVLLPQGLKALKRVAKVTGLELKGAYLNLDGGFDSRHNRKAIFNAGMIPNIKENQRNRKASKRGRKRWFNAVEFIPLSFWYDAPLTSQDCDRRHDPWLVYGSPRYSPARWSSWISPA
jgi:Transposase DDE domain